MAAHHQVRILPSSVAGIQAVEARSSRSFARHTHDVYGIGFILAGAQKSASGRGPVEAGAGDVITVNPGEVHDGAPIGDDGRFWRMLYLDADLVWRIGEDIGNGQAGRFEFSAPVLPRARLAPQLAVLFDCLTGKGEARSESAEELLLALVSGFWARPFQGATPDLRRIKLAKTRIDDAPGEPVTLLELAEICGLSRFQLLRGFAAATGFTPHAYLLQKRVDLARRLIAGKLPLAEAAVAAGFADQSHMTRAFVGRFGYSPGAFAAACR